MNRELYKRLALNGNKSAQLILDAESEEGAVPDAEMGSAESEAQELADLTELQSNVAALVAKAKVHAEAGNDEEAGEAHMARASLHEGVGQHQDAMGAYKDAALAFGKKLKGPAPAEAAKEEESAAEGESAEAEETTEESEK